MADDPSSTKPRQPTHGDTGVLKLSGSSSLRRLDELDAIGWQGALLRYLDAG